MCGQRNGEASFNLKAAPALGLDVPRKLRAFADELIESVDDRFCAQPGRSLRRRDMTEVRDEADSICSQ
jgi:hypothetical protein